MKMHVQFTIEEGPAALKQIAAVVGFANSMGINITMRPEDDPRTQSVVWGDGEVEAKDQKAYDAARDIMPEASDGMRRKEFVRALAKKIRKDPKVVGQIVKRWLRAGVMAEV